MIVGEAPEPCPYLPGKIAVLPLRYPLERLEPEAFDRLLDEGDRRSGPVLYRPKCPACDACRALRIPVARFAPTDSQLRARKKNRDVAVRVAKPEVTARHLEIFNRHKRERGLARDERDTDAATYRLNMVESCVETVEIRYEVGEELVAFSILDVGRKAASSVYHCFDPAHARRSLGVFSVLREVELCESLGLDWYYLGLWVDGCRALSYKATYFPHQKRVDGAWVEVDGQAP